jgi:hypothetical protein
VLPGFAWSCSFHVASNCIYRQAQYLAFYV